MVASLTLARPGTGKKIGSDLLTAWLPITARRNKKNTYGHLLAVESGSARSAVLPELRAYFEEAHRDAKFRFAKALRPTLSPFQVPGDGAAPGYPGKLHLTVKKGYFGEVLAGLLAEHVRLHGKNKHKWMIPLFLFRYHTAAFQHLERVAMGSAPADKAVPGRTGDDCLAFIRKNGRISHVLVCESKCLKRHHKKKLSEAHIKISEPGCCPPSVSELLLALQDYDSTTARSWQRSLLRMRKAKGNGVKRYNLIVYICAPPKKRKAWASRVTPHQDYSGTDPLDVAEIHVVNGDALVKAVYST